MLPDTQGRTSPSRVVSACVGDSGVAQMVSSSFYPSEPSDVVLARLLGFSRSDCHGSYTLDRMMGGTLELDCSNASGSGTIQVYGAPGALEISGSRFDPNLVSSVGGGG